MTELIDYSEYIRREAVPLVEESDGQGGRYAQPRYILFLALLSIATSAMAQEPDWKTLSHAKEVALQCASSSDSFSVLFALASSSSFTGADAQEALSEANEDAFLKCPVEFMLGLKMQPVDVRSKIIKFYFGVHHEPWELGAVLARLQQHPDIGNMITTEFGSYLRAKAPFEK